jgi:GGDEF domain-containing protein
LILPGTTDERAQEVLSRVCDQVINDGKQPTISLSAGFAILPRDGDIAETLRVAAERALYRMKKHHKRNPAFVKQAAV